MKRFTLVTTEKILAVVLYFCRSGKIKFAPKSGSILGILRAMFFRAGFFAFHSKIRERKRQLLVDYGHFALLSKIYDQGVATFL